MSFCKNREKRGKERERLKGEDSQKRKIFESKFLIN